MFQNKLRQTALSVAFLSLLFALSFSACKREQRAGAIPESLSSYVYGFTSGVISKASPIRVRFASAMVDSSGVSSDVKSNVISFEPSIAGKAIWEDDRTLLFEPENDLSSGTAYIATVNLSKLIDNLPRGAGSFEFDFRTRDQYFDVQTNGFSAPNPQDLSKQEYSGNLFTADIANNEEVEQVLIATQNGKNLPIAWAHESNQMVHAFTVKSIDRGSQPSEVNLEWNGKPMNVVLRGKKEIEVPFIKDFKVTDARVVQDQEQYILLFFSDPLLASQNLDGLIQINEFTGSLRHTVDGNTLRVYPSERIVGDRRITVSPGVRNLNDQRMANPSEWQVTFADAQPQVRLVGRGVILPNSNGLIFPFEAISLTAVDVEVFKIYNNNILQFLQTNELDGNYDLYRVGRVIMQKKIDLSSLNARGRSSDWTRYALDLSTLIEQDPEAMYQVRIGFRPSYSTYFCNAESQVGSTINNDLGSFEEDKLNENGEYTSIMESWYGIEGWYDGYSWSHRDDPCFPAYYNSDRFLQRNVIASNLGIIAKGGNDKSYFVSVADLRTTEPLSNVELEFYDFQQQLLTTAQTGSNGTVNVQLSRKPFVVIAKKDVQKGYLRLEDGYSLSLSRFDVAGEVTQKGLKGFMYGERGVWRPGDSVYLNFVLEDRLNKLPENYPIQFELYDARGQLQEKRTVMRSVGNVYPLYFATSTDSPTGSWRANVKAGGAEFDKTIRIETVKPNRLKINLDFGKEELDAADGGISGKLSASWLHGAPAKGLKAVVEAQLRATNTTFEKYKNYEFDDPARDFSSEPKVIFDRNLDENGEAQFTASLLDNALVPGKLSATFKTRVFERGGDFSSDNFTLPYHPFKVYAGISIPENKYGEKRLDINKDGTLTFATVNTNGSPVRNRTLSVGIYRVEWRWWWDEGYDYVSRYNSSEHFDAQQKRSLTTNAQGEATWNVKVDNWGRYLVRVCDTESGHCAGEFFYAGYPWYDDDSQSRSAAAMLPFSSDKEKYNVGENVELTIPAGEVGRYLVTLENGTKVVQSFWIDSKAGENKFTFKTTPEMTPNVYAHVSLVQPHAQAQNDLPIRMYGVIPIYIEDPKTQLNPQIKMPDELKPEQTFTVEVAEAKGKAMTYTLAVVDEGLLGLTRFNTPNPWDAFFAREALGVRTWDVYDHVLGAYGGQLERILSIGGDGEINREAAQDQANRFKPVVMHLGPFELKKGRKAKHEIKLPNYIGAVRTMVVASGDGAYGAVEKTTPVKKPLMILATLPRVLGPGESLKLPVNVFAMDNKVKNVNVSVAESSGLVNISGPKSKSISFDKPGDGLLEFDIQVAENIGVAKFTVTAQGGGERASQEIEIQVRNPNPIVTDVFATVLNPNADWLQAIQPVGMRGTNEGILEVSNIPPINLGERLDYLIQYPYGCLEQTLSGGFPQLYVNKLMELNDEQKNRIPNNIKATIDRLKQFQTETGGFAYWPGNASPDHWATSYAGHFLLEAKALGYTVPNNLLNNWERFQKKVARMWDVKLKDYGFMSDQSHQLNQAYRLYTLALAKKPEMGAMNRLRETSNLSLQAKWRLAAAYAVAGKPEVAKSLTKGLSRSVPDYNELAYTYGSDLRDEAMILEAMVLLGDREAAGQQVRDLSDALSNSRWYSTQTVSYALLSIGKFVGDSEVGKRYTFTYALNGKTVNAGSTAPIMQIEVPADRSGNVTVKNTSQATLFARLILKGQPVAGDETANASNLDISVNYRSLDGRSIDPSTIPQGTDFVAQVRITHPGSRAIPYREMALEQIFPSGWEILNTRLDNLQSFAASSTPEYQDVRDDRVQTFFDIFQGQTQTYTVRLNAAYQGRFYLPAVSCGAMYDNTINARVPGRWVEVVQPSAI